MYNIVRSVFDFFVGRGFYFLVLLSLAWGWLFFVYQIFGEHFSIGMSAWKETAYWINYLDYGFVKRATLGTVLELTPFLNVSVKAHIVSALAVLGVFGVSVFLAEKLRFLNIQVEKKFWYIVILLTSPASVPHFIYDFGRFDAILLLLFAGSAILFLSQKDWAACCISIIATLTHEIYILVFVPFLLLLLFFESVNFKTFVFRSSFFMAGVGIAGAALLFFGKFERGPEMLTSSLNDQSGIAFGEMKGEPVKVWTRDLSENLSVVYQHIKNPVNWVSFVILGTVWVMYLKLFLDITKRSSKSFLIVLALTSPLSLFFLGIDYARWVAFSIILMVAAVAYLKYKNEVDLNKPSFCILRVVSVIGIILGPLGITGSVFLFDKVIPKLI
ncbi:hypothetical protein [uncultured Halovibrio sp.]|uniref:hypothetical protein n=1 Tax=uncultured Halovibrio sp. TaxID=985049 RepID=UPI0025D11985|nr:hypothetical protein [uncultured Halovibrio sp.]